MNAIWHPDSSKKKKTHTHTHTFKARQKHRENLHFKAANFDRYCKIECLCVHAVNVLWLQLLSTKTCGIVNAALKRGRKIMYVGVEKYT